MQIIRRLYRYREQIWSKYARERNHHPLDGTYSIIGDSSSLSVYSSRDLIEPTLDEIEGKMREAELAPHEGKRKVETLWPIFKIHHQKSRYLYDLYYKRKTISKELYDYCLKQSIGDKSLIGKCFGVMKNSSRSLILLSLAQWKKQGYENLCCLRCIQPRDTNFNKKCICRVPKEKLEEGKVVECVHCGCRGCSG